MRENISPEEKLLRLIRGPKKNGVANNVGISSHSANTTDTTSAHSLPNKRNFIGFKRYQSLFSARNVIIFTFVVALLYLLLAFIMPFVFTSVALVQPSSAGPSKKEIEQKKDTRDLDSYMEPIKNKNIFTSSGAATQQPAAALNSDIMKDINLVGIVSGDSPQAIIEDKKSQKTYYLIKGQSFGDMQVDDIREGKVIINYQGQKYELYL